MQKRRERINERLKILQNLVPNGTKASYSNSNPLTTGQKKNDRMKIESKLMNSLAYFFFQVDISTMLEEAVEYVKFLQLQIKVGPRKILARILCWCAPKLCL